MRNLLFLGTCLLFTAFLVQGTSAAVPTTDTEPIDEFQMREYAASAEVPAQPSSLSKAAQDTVFLYGGPGTKEGKFQDVNGVFPDLQGWEGSDITDLPSRWSVSTWNAENLGGHGAGNHAMWCGVDDPSFAHSPGYGDGWNEILQFSTGPIANPQVGQTVSLNMYFNHDSEPGYDYLYVEYDSAGAWVMVDQFDGTNFDGF
jgi:hypothetical protein